jgi:Family of unknown function (DUF6494)
MNEDVFNREIRKFLKKVGITSQREIEKAVWARLESDGLNGDERLQVKMTLQVPDLDLSLDIEDVIALE